MSLDSRVALALIASNMTVVISRCFEMQQLTNLRYTFPKCTDLQRLVNCLRLQFEEFRMDSIRDVPLSYEKALMLMVLLHTVLLDFLPRKSRCFDCSMTWLVLPCYHKRVWIRTFSLEGPFHWNLPPPGQVTPFKIRLDRVTNLN